MRAAYQTTPEATQPSDRDQFHDHAERIPAADAILQDQNQAHDEAHDGTASEGGCGTREGEGAVRARRDRGEKG